MANSPKPNEMFINTAPEVVSQKLKLFRKGNATSRAPICSGNTKFIRPIMNGMAIKIIMMTP
ncbi:hypothetical protein swp_1423 [Shewanella piezotolerans WP3]|uniref:Uncharacterized protein n=1 Tax=Shewanella piezotolerans (strain WP3 / JCM 13877) TaxID=225849 RepID=B8CKN4_SHEPW|nr:hypothetical protein swp_1423 [Shewanella piezotolerans WP3]